MDIEEIKKILKDNAKDKIQRVLDGKEDSVFIEALSIADFTNFILDEGLISNNDYDSSGWAVDFRGSYRYPKNQKTYYIYGSGWYGQYEFTSKK